MILLNYIISFLESINVFIGTFLLTSNITLLFLDNFKLSNIRLIKFIQIFSFVCVPIYFIYNMYNTLNISLSDIIFCMADNKDINLHGYVSVNKEAGKAIGQGLQTIGT